MARHICRVGLIAGILLGGVPEGAFGAESKWIRLQSANFELYSSAGLRSARDTLREFEEVRGFFLQSYGRPPADPAPIRVVAFGSTKEYEPYRLNEFAIAYYHPSADRDYIVLSRSGADTFPVAIHEYVHLLAKHYGLKLPPWLSEGLAEVYSTLKPTGDKVILGEFVPGRYQALLNKTWVPLATILTADRSSAYYNEKEKAGSLYNEGWALTHMLYFRAEYKPKFNQVMQSISDGEESIHALTRIYGVPLKRIEDDLHSYLGRSSVQGLLVPARIERSSEDLPATPLSDFDTGLMFADLLFVPGGETKARTALEKLQKQDPQRPEPYHGIGYLSLHAGNRDEAAEWFGKAYQHGDRDAKLLWDYGRMLERKQPDDAIRVLAELLAHDSARMDVRLELADRQLAANRPQETLDVLAPIREVTPSVAPRFFRIAVSAYIKKGDQASAAAAAKHYLDVAKTEDDRTTAEHLVKITSSASSMTLAAASDPGPTDTGDDTGRPILRHSDSGAPPGATSASLQSISGRFIELACGEGQARMIVETTAGRRVFLIADPNKVSITAGSSGPVDMTCGIQKSPVTVAVGYSFPAAGQNGIDGIVKTLAF